MSDVDNIERLSGNPWVVTDGNPEVRFWPHRRTHGYLQRLLEFARHKPQAYVITASEEKIHLKPYLGLDFFIETC